MKTKTFIETLQGWTRFQNGMLESSEDDVFRFCKDFGFKAVALDTAFQKFADKGDHKLFKLFDAGDLARLNHPSGAWMKRGANLIRIAESDLMTGGKHSADEINVYSYDMTNSIPMNRGFFDALYVRCDNESGHRKGRNRDGVSLVPMRVTSKMTSFKCIKLPSGQWALAVFHPGRNTAFAFPCDDETLNFLTRASL